MTFTELVCIQSTNIPVFDCSAKARFFPIMLLTFFWNRLHIPRAHFFPLTVIPPDGKYISLTSAGINHRVSKDDYVCGNKSVPPAAAHRNILYCIALKQAVWILRLQGLLVFHGSEPPGIVDDAAEPHTCTEDPALVDKNPRERYTRGLKRMLHTS